MKKFFLILVLVLFVGALLAIILGISNSDPRYQGKSATGWALVLYFSPTKEGEGARQALKTLGSNAVPSLIRMLNKTNYSTSDKAFDILAPRLPRIWRSRVYEKYFPIEPMRARTAAAQALQAVGPEARSAIPDLCKALGDTNLVATFAAYALAGIGRESVPMVVQAMQSTDIAVQKNAILTLGFLGANGGEATPALLPRLNDPDPAIRSAAANALSKIGPAAIPNLRSILEHGNQTERLSAAKVFGSITPSNTESVQSLINSLDDNDPAVRRQVIESLGILRAGFSPVIAAVAKSLQDTNSEVRLEAVKTLGRAGRRAQTVVSQLTPLLNDDDLVVRAAAEAALTKITNSPAGNKAALNSATP